MYDHKSNQHRRLSDAQLSIATARYKDIFRLVCGENGDRVFADLRMCRQGKQKLDGQSM